MCVCVCVGETARGCGDWMQVCLGDGRRVAVFHNFPTFPPFHFCYGCFNWKMFHCFCTGNWGQVQTGGGRTGPSRRLSCVSSRCACQGWLPRAVARGAAVVCAQPLSVCPGCGAWAHVKGGRQGWSPRVPRGAVPGRTCASDRTRTLCRWRAVPRRCRCPCAPASQRRAVRFVGARWCAPSRQLQGMVRHPGGAARGTRSI